MAKNKFKKLQIKNKKTNVVHSSNNGEPFIEIELKSDLCVSAGESYQSNVDQEVVHDDYGFPYIPAKRLRGIIRETALELVEFGKYSQDVYDSLFGKEGNTSTQFVLNDACLENYEDMVREIQSCTDENLKHPQNVLSLYTYSRTQTKVDVQTGIAEKNSLRTMRVVKKGLKFFAQLEYRNISTQEKELLKDAIALTRHMGLNRTRGLGLVKMKLIKKPLGERKLLVNGEITNQNKISYSLYLDSNVICKSVEGNQTRTQDYIEGGKILGILAESLGHEIYRELIQNDEQFIASNAYISSENQRCIPVKASYQKIKDESFKEDGTMVVKNMMYLSPEKDLTSEEREKQLTPVSYSWMSTDCCVKDVETEIRYHHSRPEDKSVGHAKGSGEGEFFQLNSLMARQKFSGYLLANHSQAVAICKALKQKNTFRLGSGKYSEYGKVHFESLDIASIDVHQEEWENEFELKLNAPLIIYNENLMPSADVRDLTNLLNQLLEADLVLESSFLKYETIGGFNVTWNRKKQSMTVLGKGTVCLFSSKDKVDVSKLKNAFIGKRTKEGYGEVDVCVLKKKFEILREEKVVNENGGQHGALIIPQLEYLKKQRLLMEQARVLAKSRKVNQASLAKFMIIFKEQTSLDGIKEQIDQICQGDKNRQCKYMYEDVLNICKEDENHYEIYVREYLKALKYQLREDKKNA